MYRISIKKLFALALLLCWGVSAFAQIKIITEGWESAKSLKGVVSHLRKKNPKVNVATLEKAAARLWGEKKGKPTTVLVPKVSSKVPVYQAAASAARKEGFSSESAEDLSGLGTAAILRERGIPSILDEEIPQNPIFSVPEVVEAAAEEMTAPVAVQFERDLSRPVTAAEKWLAKAQQFVAEHGRWPRRYISGKKPAEYTPEEKAECQMGTGVRNAIMRGNPDEPVIQALKALKEQHVKEYATSRTPEEWLAEVQQFVAEHGRWPRHYISGKKPAEYTPEEKAECQMGTGVRNAIMRGNPDEPVIQALKALKEQHVNSPLTPREIHQKLEDFMAKTGQYPSSNSSLSGRIYYRLNKSEKLPDGTYADPDVQALYEFDQLARQTRYGEKRWNEIMRPKEVTPEEPGTEVVHKKRSRIGSDSVAAIEDTGHVFNFETGYAHLPAYQQGILDKAAHKADERLAEFPQWVRNNYKYFNLDSKGQDALRMLGNFVAQKEMLPEDSPVWDIVDLFHQSELGPREDGGFTRMLYGGKNPRSLQSSDFYTVTEYKGLYVYNAEFLPYPEYITFVWSKTEKDVLEGIKLQPGVTNAEVEELFDALLEEGWEIRMGDHELGISGDGTTLREQDGILHVHFEGEAEFGEEGDIEEERVSDWINIYNAREAIAPDARTPDQIAKAYKHFFGKYYYKR